MPTTSNFGWTTPADTDLVKDGAAAIRTLGNGIDTSLIDLKGGTTGQVLSKASNTDLDYSWVTPNVGDITEVQAGTGISIASGTGPIPVITNTVATEYDAKGDLIVGTGADTFAKLSVGTNNHILVADSSTSTGLKWAAPASGTTFAGVSLENTPNNQSLTNNTWTVITWDTENFDTDGYHSTTTNTSRITIPSGKAGKYLFTGSVYFDPSSTAGMRELALYKNGTNTGKFFIVTAYGTGTWYPNPQVNFVADAAVGDYFQLYARQNSGGNITQYFDSGCWFQASYLGA